MAIYYERKNSLNELKQDMAQAQANYDRVLSLLENAMGGNTEALTVMRKNKTENLKKLINSFSRMSGANFALLVNTDPDKAIEALKYQTKTLNSFLNNSRICIANVIENDNGKQAVNDEFKQLQNFLKEVDANLDNYTALSNGNPKLMQYANWISAKSNELKDLFSENISNENRIRQNYKVIVDDKDRIPVYDKRSWDRDGILNVKPNSVNQDNNDVKNDQNNDNAIIPPVTNVDVDKSTENTDVKNDQNNDNAIIPPVTNVDVDKSTENTDAKNDQNNDNAIIPPVTNVDVDKSSENTDAKNDQSNDNVIIPPVVDINVDTTNDNEDYKKQLEEERKNHEATVNELATVYAKQEKNKKRNLITGIVAGVLILGTIIGSGFIGKAFGRKSAAADLKDKDATIVELNADLQEALNQIQTLTGDKEEIEKAYQEFQKKVEESELKHNETLLSWQKLFNDEVAEREKLQAQYDALMAEHEQLKIDYENAIKNDDSALINSLRERIALQGTQISSLTNQLNAKDKELTDKINEYNVLEEKYNDLKEQLENHECEYPSELINQLKAQVAEAEQKAQQAEQKATEAEQKAQQAEADRLASEQEKLQAQQEAEQAKQELEASKNELERTKQELAEAKNTIKDLNDKLASMEKENQYGGQVSNEGANQQGGASQVTDNDKTQGNENEDSGHVSGNINRDPHESDDYTRE